MALFSKKFTKGLFGGKTPARQVPKTETFLVLDVETPNRDNDRISAISFARISGTELLWVKSSLINPEVPFDRFNVELTGIQPHEANRAPTFPQVWEALLPELESSILVAHNASFDLTVLNKTCRAYQIDFPQVSYIDTVEAARDLIPGLPHYRLNDLCDYLNIALNHHNVESDCRACAELLCRMLCTAVSLEPYVRRYTGELCAPKSPRRTPQVSDKTRAINQLQELLRGVAADGKVTEEETYEIYQWLAEHEELRGNFPFDRIYATVTDALEDGILEPEELNRLLTVCQALIDPTHHGNACPCSDLSGKLICLTGDFVSGSKEEVAAKLASQGAIVKKGVVLKLDYLIVGELGSAAWCSGNYGTKVKKALENQSKGSNVQIVREKDVLSLLN